MKISGNIAKMLSVYNQDTKVSYSLPLGDQIISLNKLLGQKIKISFSGQINCISCGRITKKSFHQGYCYHCFQTLPECDICILQPEKCHLSYNTCRNATWAKEFCEQPHIVYLANTSSLKVGITRQSQIPTRWIDQGAAQALPIFQTENRYLSGVIEHACRQFVSDRTNWKKMLLQDGDPNIDLFATRSMLLKQNAVVSLPDVHQLSQNAITLLPQKSIIKFSYPILIKPTKIIAINLDITPKLQATLIGIKGQYLIFDSGVLNVRKFSGYNICLEV